MANTHSLDLESSSSQYAYASDNASLSITGSLTIEMWVKFESLPLSGSLMGLVNKNDIGLSQGGYGVWMYNNSGTYQVYIAYSPNGLNFSGNEAYINWTPSTGVWYHLAVVFDLSVPQIRLYVNGIQQGSSVGTTGTSIYDNNEALGIGVHKYNGSLSNYYDGLIDDIRLWNVVRSQSDINTYKDQELTGSESGLVGYWKLNNNYNDSTSNGNNLTAVNSPIFSTDVPFVSGDITISSSVQTITFSQPTASVSIPVNVSLNTQTITISQPKANTPITIVYSDKYSKKNTTYVDKY